MLISLTNWIWFITAKGCIYDKLSFRRILNWGHEYLLSIPCAKECTEKCFGVLVANCLSNIENSILVRLDEWFYFNQKQTTKQFFYLCSGRYFMGLSRYPYIDPIGTIYIISTVFHVEKIKLKLCPGKAREYSASLR